MQASSQRSCSNHHGNDKQKDKQPSISRDSNCLSCWFALQSQGDKPGMWGNSWASVGSKTLEWKCASGSTLSPSSNISPEIQHCIETTSISGSALISFSPLHTSCLSPSLCCHIHVTVHFSEQQLRLCALLGNGPGLQDHTDTWTISSWNPKSWDWREPHVTSVCVSSSHQWFINYGWGS